ncbi:MarR family winged helix-turn-helix transcriptional regulator [Devosia sediminis]|uniref:Winged helix-turn-helix transcriptional regulator n=1 Tax=Devosia sediminis TaxID=2798801 RepID=A0A934IUG8_9HYPH|nr:MarR family winged helix-turn-helix transcriptional regulator [Devosia sediminis]MBJ3785361.1 winged helix-turn-helix transcriptional regulator [Devosia sediminis]
MPLSDKTQFSTLLTEAGIAPETAEAVMDIDWVIQQWRRRAMKRELGQRALQDLGIGLDLAQFDVLAVIVGPVAEAGREADEVMVSTVAERLSIDPSRASRLVSEMVDQGYARRAVSQADARRTIIELTERGQTVVDAVRAYKFLIMGDFLGQWSQAELDAFIPMLKRFSTWIDGIGPSTEKHAEEIAALSARLASAKSDELA